MDEGRKIEYEITKISWFICKRSNKNEQEFLLNLTYILCVGNALINY